MDGTESSGFVYVIKSIQGDTYKVGFTRNWHKRRRQLEVGKKTQEIRVFVTRDPYDVEKTIHRIWDWRRLPQSEWFTLDENQLSELLQDIEVTCQRYQKDWDRKLAQVSGSHNKNSYEQIKKPTRVQIRQPSETVYTGLKPPSSVKQKDGAIARGLKQGARDAYTNLVVWVITIPFIILIAWIFQPR